ncbi:PPOX class F420-dependent oxidoreductase [Streptomyces arenae]|uniref:PPOX class F420-dependent oxidoreductase n=1 Tax=Streptomyces arenae TaxID=29301 RepID=UPI00265ADBD8|nr:PPOX class F420-dependent oxidoreductase [Streptomyces arenae]MCG7202267.1 PPOX class F420-dependent oxidoreductase [Streptomyces arenae]
MTTDEWHSFVSAGTRSGKVATVGSDNTPMIAPVWFVLDGGDIAFTTGVKSAKARNLRRNPRASVCVADDIPPFSYVEIRGLATLSEDPDELIRIATLAAARYMGPDKAEEYGRRNSGPGVVLIRVRPEKVHALSGIAD